MGRYDNKTREELVGELQKLQNDYDGLVNSFGSSYWQDAVEKLKKYQDKIKYLMAAAHIAWWEVDLTNRRVYFDPRSSEMFGYKPDKFIRYKDFTDLIHPQDYGAAFQAMKDLLLGKNDIYDIEFRIMSSTGEYLWIRDLGSIVNRDTEGKPRKMAGIVIDINERKKVEVEINLKTEQLQKSNAEKEKFLSILAHDLKGPLNSFMGFTDILMTNIENLSTTNILEISKMMNDSANNLYRLLDNLLEWSRIKQGLMLTEPYSMNLSKEVDVILTSFLDTAAQKQIELRPNIDLIQTVFVDPHMLKSILRNLVYNAIKFTPRGGKVEINAALDEMGLVVVEIKDNGIGMDQTMLSNLFRLDVNTKRSGTENEPTSGLGLILCKDFIEENGGAIWVKSEIGVGSSFYFSLPAGLLP